MVKNEFCMKRAGWRSAIRRRLDGALACVWVIGLSFDRILDRKYTWSENKRKAFVSFDEVAEERSDGRNARIKKGVNNPLLLMENLLDENLRDGRNAGIQGAVSGSEVGKRVLGMSVALKYKGTACPFLMKGLMDENLSGGETGAVRGSTVECSILS